MVPAHLLPLPALPLNANGKVDRAALPDPAVSAPAGTSMAAATGRIEEIVTAAWRQVLGIEEIGPNDSFFDVGGHSLLLVRVQALLEAGLGQPIPLVTLFQYPTIATLAAHLRGPGERIEASPLGGPAHDDAIAIVGMAGRFPGAPDLDAFWDRLRTGAELLRRFTRDELVRGGVPQVLIDSPHYVPVRGALDGADLFDAELFGYTPREATMLDPQHRLLLECAWAALEDAGHPPATTRANRIGVYAGCSDNGYGVRAATHGALAAADVYDSVIGRSRDFLATRLAYKLQLGGPAVTVQTACSTSLMAVHSACQALRSGDCDMALAGGVSVTVPAVGGYLHQPEGIASVDGHCRPFDANASGTVAGNGVGVVVLKPLARALADGDAIRAVIRGTAANNDAADKVGFTAPSVTGQAQVIAAAHASAGITPDAVSYVEAHGTGTALGDPIEVAALRQVWASGKATAPCALGSVKANVGHLDAAAGVTGLIKTVLALQHREIPPTPHFERPNPQLDLGVFHVPATAEPWEAAPGTSRRAGVSSFGMGGTNVHVVVEEAPQRTSVPALAREWQIVPVAAHTGEALAASAQQLATFIDGHPDVSLTDLAWTQQVGRAPLRTRTAVVGRSHSDLSAALRAASAVSAPRTLDRPCVWMFPGQGAQLHGLGRELYDSEPVFRHEIDACANTVRRLLGEDLRTVMYTPTSEEEAAARLRQTMWTQVSLVVVELALAALWRSWGVKPAVVIGHSVGEIAAACVARVLTREDALALVISRGRLMQAATPGGMTAVAADAATAQRHLTPAVTLAAVNAPSQCVVAGPAEALAAFEASAVAGGLVVHRLAAAGAFHSPLMAAVEGPLTAAASELPLASAAVPWISTVTAAVVDTATATDPRYWGAQVTAPVRWMDAVGAAASSVGGDAAWLEVGPGHTLGHLVRQCRPDGAAVMPSLDGEDSSRSLAAALGALWSAHVGVDWHAYHGGEPRARVPLPTYPFQRQRFWLEERDTVAPPASVPLHRHDDEEGWFYAQDWVRRPLRQRLDSALGTVVICAADAVAARELVQAAEAAGGTTITILPGTRFEHQDARCYVVDPTSAADLARAWQNVAADWGPVAKVIYAWGVAGADATTARMRAERALLGLVALASAIETSVASSPVDLLILLTGVHDITAGETVEPWTATVLGLSRALVQDAPGVRCRVLDMDADGGPLATAIMELRDGVDRLVAYRHGTRWIEQFSPYSLPAVDGTPTRLRDGGVYLITGGTGRIGLEIAGYLARAVRARLTLVSRSASMEDPAVANAARRLQQFGAEVLVIAADVADVEALRAAIDLTERRFGSLHGVIHAAGATSGPSFEHLPNLTRAAFEAQFTPKADGAIALAAAVRGRRLDFCALMSSLSTVLGGAGFGAYAAANAFLDAFAAHASHSGDTPWVAIGWEGWHFDETAAPVGSTAALALTPAQGAGAFARIMNGALLPRVVVSTADLGARVRAWGTSDRQPGPAMPQNGSAARHVSANHVAPATPTERSVADIWEELMGQSPIGTTEDFFELGGHSLLGTQVISRCRVAFGVDLSLSILFANPTIVTFAAAIDARARTRGEQATDASTLLQRVKSLSHEERQQLLAEARRKGSLTR
nr:type I polyketide synthase [uncultured bacterium]